MTAVIPDLGQDRRGIAVVAGSPSRPPPTTSHEGGYNGRRRVRTASKGGSASRRRSAGRQAAAQAGSGERRGQAAGRERAGSGEEGRERWGDPTALPSRSGGLVPIQSGHPSYRSQFPSRGTAFHHHGLDVQRVTAGNARDPREKERPGARRQYEDIGAMSSASGNGKTQGVFGAGTCVGGVGVKANRHCPCGVPQSPKPRLHTHESLSRHQVQQTGPPVCFCHPRRPRLYIFLA